MCRNFIFLFIIFPIFSVAKAAEPVGQNTDGAGKTFWQKRNDEFQSPWTTEARPWLLWGTGTTVLLAILEDQIDDPVQGETTEDKPLGKFSQLGDYGGQTIPNFLYIFGMGLTAWVQDDVKASANSLAMWKATAYAVGSNTLLKFLVHEPRPNNSSGNRSYASFPSGHTAAAFSFSSTVVARHGMWPWGYAATALAMLTGYSRINDNAHYLHDVVGGFTIGTVYGLGISYLEQRKMATTESDNKEKASAFYFLPVYDEDIKGGILAYEF